VLWDPAAADPTGRDASYCFVSDRITKEEFERRFPDASKSSLEARGMEGEGWTEGDMVRVAEYWRMDERPIKIAMMQDGSIRDITDEAGCVDAGAEEARRDADDPRFRCKYATMVFTNGQEELAEPFELKIPRVPIIRWMGRETWIGERRVRYRAWCATCAIRHG
jgi:hypothetical protein